MARIPTSLLAYRMARLEVLEYVTRLLLREHLRHSGQAESGLRACADQARHHFETHPPHAVPRAEMTAAIDWFFNTLAADLKAEPGDR